MEGRVKSAAQKLGVTEYEVGGKKYSRVDPQLNPKLEKLYTKAAEKMASAYAGMTPNESSTRIYKRVILDRDNSPITEKEFTPEELSQLKIAANRAIKDGRDYIDYKDYRADGKKIIPGLPGRHNVWRNIIGRANIKKDKDGNVVIEDKYNFNYSAKQNDGSLGGKILSNLGGEFFSPAWLGRRVAGSEVGKDETKGASVKIKLKDFNK